jgi:hypothetical protein
MKQTSEIKLDLGHSIGGLAKSTLLKVLVFILTFLGLIFHSTVHIMTKSI